MVEKVFATAKDLRIGRYVLIDDIPCRIVEIETSKTGKHGAGKMRITGIGVFEGQKKTLLAPADSEVESPIIERKDVQVLTVSGKTAQVMDKASYEMYEIEVPEDMQSAIEAGKEAEVLEAMGRKKLERIK